MSSTLEDLAALTQDPALALQAAARIEHLRLHVADTLGMMLQGAVLYQVALALLSPERLMEFDRTPPFETKALRALAAKVRVRADARLEAQYPETWPAHVVVERSGKSKSTLVSIPCGDAQNPMQWEDVLLKCAPYGSVLMAIRAVHLKETIPSLVLDAYSRGKLAKKKSPSAW